MQRLLVEQDGCFWVAVPACHWAEVFQALMAVLVTPCKATFDSSLHLVALFFFSLVL